MRSGEFRLRDGRVVLLRDAERRDIPAIARLFTDLSPESFRSRFLAGGASSPALVLRLASFEPPATCVVAAPAQAPRRLAAEARYVPTGEGAAELAITVLDAYQGMGLGRLLLGALVERAREAGLTRLRAVVGLGNTRMLRLVESYGWALAAPADRLFVACLEISATGGMPGWPASAAGRRALVERRGWFDDERVARLEAAGYDVRRCLGPRQQPGNVCPLLVSGRCRLAEEADLIAVLLPGDDPDRAAIVEAHRRRWPHRLAG